MPVRRLAALLILGLLIREIFSFWTGHPSDFEIWVRLGYAMTHGGDPYGILPPVPGLSFANVFSVDNASTIAYLPFWPLVTGLIYTIYSMVGLNDRFVYYFLLKQPVIFGDVALAYLLYSYVSSRKPGDRGFWVLLFWLFSPFTIIISGIWGMLDSIAISFLMISVESIGQFRTSFWTGLSIFAKSIPIIYAAPTTLMNRKKVKGLSAFVVAIGLPATLSVATFMIMGWSLSIVSMTLASTAGKGGWSMSVWDAFSYFNYLGLLPAVPPAVYGMLGLVWIPALVIFTWIAIRRFRTETDYGLFQALIVCTLAFLIFKAQVAEQYALYLFALAVVDVTLWNPQRKRLLVATVVVAMVYLVMNNYFLVRFLSPVYPGFVSFESEMYSTIGPARYAINFLTGAAFTVLNIRYLADVLTGRPADSKALTSTEAIELTVKDQKTGRSNSRSVWFVLESGKLYLLPLTGSDSEWYKNILVNAEVQISSRSPLTVLGMKGRKLTAHTKPIQGPAEVADVVQKFKSKYGATEFSKTYSKLDAAVQVLI